MSHWFMPKTYGYGASPANWQGWAATFAFIAAVVGVTLVMVVWQADALTGPTAWQFSAWLLVIAALLAAFIGFARAKTSGQWGWRWGK
jgi:hypothetical protein